MSDYLIMVKKTGTSGGWGSVCFWRHVTERAFKWSKSRGRVKASRDPYERGYV